MIDGELKIEHVYSCLKKLRKTVSKMLGIIKVEGRVASVGRGPKYVHVNIGLK